MLFLAFVFRVRGAVVQLRAATSVSGGGRFYGCIIRCQLAAYFASAPRVFATLNVIVFVVYIEL